MGCVAAWTLTSTHIKCQHCWQKISQLSHPTILINVRLVFILILSEFLKVCISHKILSLTQIHPSGSLKSPRDLVNVFLVDDNT